MVFSEENVFHKVTSQSVGHRPSSLCVCVCVCRVRDTCVPEIRSRGPFQSEAGQVHGRIHQQEEDGHNTGDGVELPRKKHQLERKARNKGRGKKERGD